MKILAVEFSSEQRSIALVEQQPDGRGRVCGFAEEKGGRTSHAIHLVERVLQQAGVQREEIGSLAVGLGPGSYTGIRAAIALAQGWQLAQSIKLLGISSMDCLAEESRTSGLTDPVQVIVDAQRNEFYLAGYRLEKTGASLVESLHITGFDAVQRRIDAGEYFIGPDARSFFSSAHDLYPTAATLGKLACGKSDYVAGEKLEPIYLRPINFVEAPPSRIISD
ncbi:MAG: tRNA (adenosine(37)-N6)-threonylcarbamoyltransferase complex dimerization subunit type 1 TsaB [Verrucomicrobiota bacterium]